MSWAKHCCLLKIEASYQLVAEDTPLCAPWSDNSPLCSAIGFPYLPDLSAPTRTVLHSLAWQHTAVLFLVHKVNGRCTSWQNMQPRQKMKKLYLSNIWNNLATWSRLALQGLFLLLLFCRPLCFRFCTNTKWILQPHKWKYHLNISECTTDSFLSAKDPFTGDDVAALE